MRSLHFGRRSAAATIAAATLVLMLAIPGTALAANTATFSLPKPAKGSRSIVARPAISISVYDRYGVRYAANYSMTVDGKTVKPRITYTKSRDYRRFKLTYSVPASLAVATHKVAVRVHDLKHKTSAYSWTFTVLAPPPPPPAEMPAAGVTCASCHTGFPAAHPMTDCPACHGPSSPPAPDGQPMNRYVPTDRSAHSIGCALQSACHRGGGAFPHALDGDCMRCHSESRPGIPAVHTMVLTDHHLSTSTFCTTAGCHLSSLTKEHYDGHYRRSVGGTRLTCATCHADADPEVVAAISEGSTACESCHRFRGSAHAGTTAGHATTDSACLAAGCHTGGAVELHSGTAAGCAACHGAGRKASTVCTTCHVTGLYHTRLPAAHTVAPVSCTVYGCHPGATDVSGIHATQGCATCHLPGRKATLVCATVGCHTSDPAASHTSHPSKITTGTVLIRGTGYGTHLCSECHASTELQAVHGGVSSCAKCHPAPRSSFAVWNKGCVQGACHSSGALAMHGSIDASHTTASTPSCISADCHSGGTDVVKIHAAQGCTVCHGAGKPKLTLVCATTGCHGGADTHPASNPHAKMTPGHTAGLSATCVKTGCHAAELATLHGPALRCATCHGIGKTPTKDCAISACHPLPVGSTGLHPKYVAGHVAATGGCVATGCHVADVITLHTAGTTPPGCPACHNTGKPKLTTVCATVGCHDTGAPASHAAHPATIVSGAISILGTSHGTHLCSECHATTELQAVHGGSASCAKCHPAPRSSFSVWAKGCVQGGCHKAGTALAMHAAIDTSHTVAASSCTVPDCHAGGTDVTKIHAAQGCTVCHGAGKPRLTLVCATVGCHATGASPSHTSHPATVTSSTISILGSSWGKHLCSECHATTELQAVHGGNSGCAKCHPTPRSSFQTWAKGCVQGDCHKTGTALAMHAAIDTSHTAATAPSCTVTGCHTGGTDVTKIHQLHGCTVCHGAGKPKLTLACATAGCHESGAPPSHSSHPSTVTSSTLSILGSSYGKHLCSECHATTELQAAHGGASSCAKCHPSPRSSFQVWNKGCVQGTCHKVGTTLALHGAIDTSHTVPAAPSCIAADCHAGGTDVVKIHLSQGCAVCHGAGKPKLTLVCATAGCHGGADAHPASNPHPKLGPGHTTGLSATCVKAGCHASELATLHAPALRCATCHGIGKTPSKDCSLPVCHPYAVSSVTLHPKYVSGHVGASGDCVSAGCHTGGADITAIHTKQGCGACHGTGKPKLTTLCATVGCHSEGAPPSHASHPSTVTSATISIRGTGYGTHLCAECHVTMELQAVHGGASSCTKCHPAPRSSFGTWNKGCVQGTCHANGPLAMHGSIDSSHTVASAPSCIASDCHVGGTDVARIHSAGGCAVCHGPGKPKLTTVCATTGCHGGSDPHPASNPHPKMAPGHTTGLSATCVKVGCHAAELATLHAPALRCATCHGTGKTPGKDCSVTACHPYGVSSVTLHPKYISGHTSGATASCVAADCHAGTRVTSLHSAQGCATCHDGTALTLECSTAGCHGAGDGHPASDPHPKMTPGHTTALPTTCVKTGCHASELAELHAPAQGCATCHGTGKTPGKDCAVSACHPYAVTSVTLHPKYVSGHALAAVPSCVGTGCHVGGADVVTLHTAGTTPPGCEACHDAGKPALTTFCATAGCHDANLADLHPAPAHTVTAHPCTGSSCHGSNAPGIHAGTVSGCAACHKGGPASTSNCTSCHPLPWAAPHTGYGVSGDYHGNRVGTGSTDWSWYSTGWILAPYARGASLSCPTCHNLSGTPNLYNFPAVVNGRSVSVTNGYEYPDLCVACHGGTTDGWHEGCFWCHEGDTGSDGLPFTFVGRDCSACHSHGSVGWPHGSSGWMGGPTL